MRPAGILGACICVVAVVAASATASARYTKGPTDACLVRHHVLLTQHSLVFVHGLGMPVTSVESFAFTGVPSGTVDTGALLFTPSAAAAKRAETAYFDYYVRYDVNKLHQPRKSVVSALKAMDRVVGNVFVPWDNYPQSHAATTILRSCLR